MVEGRLRSNPGAILARLASRLAAPPASHVLLALIPAGFLLLETFRTYPLIDDFPADHWGGDWYRADDWYAYRILAQSVLHDGWTIPIASRNYNRPGGFLYVYFVAGVMSLLGENSAMVYLVQSALLGLSAVVMYLGFCRELSPGARLAYLGMTTSFLYLDAFRYYTNRLLSENLVVVLLPVALVLVLRAHERPSPRRGAIAGIALGAAILTRPNLLLLGPAAAALLMVYRSPGDRAVRAAVAALSGMLAVIGIMVFRNYIVTGEPGAAVFTETWHWIRPGIPSDAGPLEQTWTATLHYGRRVLFMLGFLPVLEPMYHVRPHWLLMWAGVGVFGVTAWRRPVAFWEAVLVVGLIAYVSPLVAVAHIANYGFRMFMPVVPIALLLAVRGVERWRSDEPRPGPACC